MTVVNVDARGGHGSSSVRCVDTILAAIESSHTDVVILCPGYNTITVESRELMRRFFRRLDITRGLLARPGAPAVAPEDETAEAAAPSPSTAAATPFPFSVAADEFVPTYIGIDWCGLAPGNTRGRGVDSPNLDREAASLSLPRMADGSVDPDAVEDATDRFETPGLSRPTPSLSTSPATGGSTAVSGLVAAVNELMDKPVALWKDGMSAVAFDAARDRAKTAGGGSYLTLLLGRLLSRGVRVHLVGHSLGCLVMSEAVATLQSAGILASHLAPGAKRLASLVLIQPALSRWAFADSSETHPRDGDNYCFVPAAVAQPVVVTYSVEDIVLREHYPRKLFGKMVATLEDRLKTLGDVDDLAWGSNVDLADAASGSRIDGACLGAHGPPEMTKVSGETAVQVQQFGATYCDLFGGDVADFGRRGRRRGAPIPTRVLGVKGKWANNGFGFGRSGWCRSTLLSLVLQVFTGRVFPSGTGASGAAPAVSGGGAGAGAGAWAGAGAGAGAAGR